MKKNVVLLINGNRYEMEIAPQATLLEVLRDHIGLTGAKEACDGGECGACTVLCDGKAVLSCLLLALEAEGKSITTIEGLAENGELSPIQKAFVDEGAIQCGYCTPGMVLSAKALLDHNPRPSRDETRKGMSGNLCRCTGYTKIVAAIEKLANAGEPRKP